MKVVFRHYAALETKGGSESYVLDMARYMADRGHDVTVSAVLLWAEGRERPVHPDGFRYLKGGGTEIPSADVCYATSPVAVGFTRKPRGCKFIAGTHTTAMFRVRGGIGRLVSTRNIAPLLSTFFFKLLNPWVMERLDALHITNPYYWALRHPRKYLIPVSVDASIFRPRKERRKSFSVLFAGRKSWDKGYDTYLEATRGLARLEEETKRWLTPEEMAERYSEAHAVVAPSRLDTFGSVQLEALMCNTPVLTTPLPEHIAANLPVLYADQARTFRLRLLEMRRVWEKSPELFEERYATGLRSRVLENDTHVQYPRFERMLEDVVANTA